ncbi:MAG: 50S ribosomal protein L21 [bacterium]
MYAVIKHSGKQYVVKQGDIITVDRIKNAQKDAELQINDVLLLNDGTNTVVGNPAIASTFVKARVMDEIKGDKVVIFKHKRRKNYRKKQGFRHIYTRIKIEDIIYQKV